VVDAGNHRVQAFDPDGSYTGQGGMPGRGQAVPDARRYRHRPDEPQHRRGRYGATSACRYSTLRGDYLSQFGSLGSANGQFTNPASVAIDPATHNIFVTDTGNHRVQIFAPQ
jgi:DNA-binding beta-propeller fold protein YncE